MIGKLLNGSTRKFAERHGVVSLLFVLFMVLTFMGGREFLAEVRAFREAVVLALTRQTDELKVIREDQIKGRSEAVKEIIQEVRRRP